MTVATVDNRSAKAPKTAAVPQFSTGLATTPGDLSEVFRLRYEVFSRGLGAGGDSVDHTRLQETDRFDAASDHLVLRDTARAPGSQIVGVYRLLDQAGADSLGGFYSETEFDLSALRKTGQPLLELGRSCLHPDYRGGAALMHLWQGVADYVATRGIDVLFGTASFPTTDVDSIAGPLSLLHHNHLAPSDLRVQSRTADAPPLQTIADIDRLSAMRQTPALIKAYLRLGGVIGQGVFVDRAFNCTDVCMILDAHAMTPEQGRLYTHHLDRG